MGGIRVNMRMQTALTRCMPPERRLAEHTAPIDCLAMRSPKRSCSAQCAGRAAAEDVARRRHSGWDAAAAAPALDLARSVGDGRPQGERSPVSLQTELQDLMWEQVGLFRTGAQLDAALKRIRQMRDAEWPRLRIAAAGPFNMHLHDRDELWARC